VRRGQTLFIDADDTLWENNIYYERVIDRFCALLAAQGRPAAMARQRLAEIERVRTKAHGYGVENFHGSLRLACRELLAPAEPAAELAELARLCAALARRTPVLLDGVEPTLRHLSGRHRLILFTKGDRDDQLRKLHRAGVGGYFHQVDVVREKDTDAYHDAVNRHGLCPDHVWMVGNSPRSDVKPAIEAGLGAVFIPHHATWELEHGEVPAACDGRLLVLERFEDLQEYF
jgi:putative hydrolase of the HAD superfamily